MCLETQDMYDKIKIIRDKITYAIEKYLDFTIGLESCDNDQRSEPGTVCKDEIGWSYNNDGTITINYVVYVNIYGDISDERDMIIDCSILDKYYNI